MDYIEVLVIVLAMTIVIVLYMLRSLRVQELSSPYEGTTMAYFESIRNLDPEEGIDYIVNYIQNPKYGGPPQELPDFLFAMAERKDGFGEAARKKIRDLGLLPSTLTVD